MLKKLLSEFAGSFFLVFAGTGAIVVNNATNGSIGHIGICMVFALVICVMVYAFGNVSGAHMNPAVTIGLWSAGIIKIKDVPGYIVAQVAGAFAATLTLKWFFPMEKLFGTCQPYNDSWKMAFGMEFILTFLLVFTILMVITGEKEYPALAGIIIGGVILLDCLVGGPVSGAGLNPSRCLSPAIISGTTKHLWCYIAGPIGGALVAAIGHSIIYREKENKPA
ncbi:MAG: aquaporin [Bacteroidia bacterium]|nr:aquaporin [Bacteroidia bacterium]